MSDLAAAIRAKLAQLDKDLTGALTYGPVEVPMAVIEAVLDLHKPMQSDVDEGLICSCLPDADDHYMAHDYPCGTVRAIAEKLGVEVADADPA